MTATWSLAVLEAVSVAVALTVAGPAAWVVVFHGTDQPFVPFVSTPMEVPSTAKATWVMPSASEAVAVTFTVPPTVAPAVGEVRSTLGSPSGGGGPA